MKGFIMKIKTMEDTITYHQLLARVHHLKTVHERIKCALWNGITLTHEDANKWPFCTSRLSAYIFKLRREDEMRIDTEIIPVKTGDGRTAHVARYSIRRRVKRRQRAKNRS